MSKSVHVAVGVIISTNEHQQTQYFLTKRLNDAHQGGKWEFPGGKLEKNETIAQALARELKEEVNIEVLSCQPLMVIHHDYGDKKVCLEVFVVDNYIGEPSAQEGQEQSWFTLKEFNKLDFPKANEGIIAKLTTCNL
ncbi:MAG: 8-oxo-dGTP diphosphatase MutT [Gammaproteobacteria bacterium]|jgi:8-oxo-dGTP diphosphatase|nr:MAG: 8-oxo-dGTP diphosphatase MutT [Gammaproteobacteria bacterium]PHR84536.1 MAG: 8-oxo-dGTP diphosphatase MutT [Colwellia sp.]